MPGKQYSPLHEYSEVLCSFVLEEWAKSFFGIGCIYAVQMS